MVPGSSGTDIQILTVTVLDPRFSGPGEQPTRLEYRRQPGHRDGFSRPSQRKVRKLA